MRRRKGATARVQSLLFIFHLGGAGLTGKGRYGLSSVLPVAFLIFLFLRSFLFSLFISLLLQQLVARLGGGWAGFDLN